MRWCLIALACGMVSLSQPARAEVKVWIGQSGNWTLNTPWSPFGRPDNGDDVFLTSGDALDRTVTYNDTSLVLRVYRSVRLDSTGTGLMTLQQVDPDTDLNAEFLYVGNTSRGTYDMFAGRGVFGATEVNAQGLLSVRSGTQFFSDSLLQAGGTVDAIGEFNVTGTYTFNGGAASGSVSAATFLNNGGAFGGGVTALNRLVLGGNGNGTFGGGITNHGPLTIPAGRTLSVGGSLTQIGANFTQIGDVSVATFTSVNSGATWLQSGGTHVTRSLSIAGDGTGSYAIGPGAQLTAAGLDIAIAGDGSFTQTGGVVSITGNLTRSISLYAPGRMYWNMSDGSFTHGGNFVVGVKDAISGTFIQSGGSTHVRLLSVNVDATTTASVNLFGGSFIADMSSVNHGTWNQTGGSALFVDHLDGLGAINVTGTGSLSVRRLRQLSLFVGGDGAVSLDPPVIMPNLAISTHRVRSLAFEQAGNVINGRVDLGASRLVIDYGGASPVADIRRYLASGYASGSWNGTGLSSATAAADAQHATALGYSESSDIFGAAGGAFYGLFADSSAVLVAYTRYGDANLDGTVNLADFNRLASNFGQSNRAWSQGDFTYDGLVNLQDFNKLAANFGLSATCPDVTPQDWAALAAAVPEPLAPSRIVAALAYFLTRRGKPDVGDRHRVRQFCP